MKKHAIEICDPNDDAKYTARLDYSKLRRFLSAPDPTLGIVYTLTLPTIGRIN